VSSQAAPRACTCQVGLPLVPGLPCPSAPPLPHRADAAYRSRCATDFLSPRRGQVKGAKTAIRIGATLGTLTAGKLRSRPGWFRRLVPYGDLYAVEFEPKVGAVASPTEAGGCRRMQLRVQFCKIRTRRHVRQPVWALAQVLKGLTDSVTRFMRDWLNQQAVSHALALTALSTVRTARPCCVVPVG
jgi:hypothetical protein